MPVFRGGCKAKIPARSGKGTSSFHENIDIFVAFTKVIAPFPLLIGWIGVSTPYSLDDVLVNPDGIESFHPCHDIRP